VLYKYAETYTCVKLVGVQHTVWCRWSVSDTVRVSHRQWNKWCGVVCNLEEFTWLFPTWEVIIPRKVLFVFSGYFI